MQTALQPQLPLAPQPQPQQQPSALQPGQSQDSTSVAGLEGAKSELTSKLDEIKKTTDGLHPPTLDGMPPMPQAKQASNPLQGWGAAAMAFAAIGSMMTRQPMVTAMNSAAAALKAIRAGDVEQANAEYSRWKVATENALKLHKFQMDEYKAALSKASTDEKGALAQFTATATAFRDENAVQIAQQRNTTAINHLMLDRDKQAREMLEAMPKIEAAKALNLAMTELKKSPEYQQADPMKKAGMQIDVVKKHDPKGSADLLADDDLKGMAYQVIAGDRSPFQGLGYGNTGAANRQRLNHMIQQIGRDEFSMSPQEIGSMLATANAEFQGMKAGERAVGTRTAQVGMAGSELQRVLPLAREASRAVDRGKFVPLNKAELIAREANSDPKVRRFVAATNTLINVYARAVSPSGVPTVNDKEHARELLSTADGPEAYEAALDQLSKEVAAAKKAPGDVRQEFRDAMGGHKGNEPHITSQQEWDALPSGSFYYEPDGKRYKKP